jgi:S-methylmethionine-dependent homocysteine/selenocysteine methylase/SAM-dependent methyltransferase
MSGGYGSVLDRLAAGACVILDGGIATELPGVRAGHLEPQDERLWGIRALVEDPGAVLDVHRRYAHAGCDVLSTNSWALPTAVADGTIRRWETSGPVHWMDLAREAVRLARAAAEPAENGRPAVAFSLNGDVDRPEGAETIRLLSRAFADEPPDLILLETLSLVRPSLTEAIARLVDTGLPVWLSFRRCRHGLCGVYGQHWGGPEGDAFGRAARRFEEAGVGALLVNCIPPDHVDGMVAYLRDFCDLPLGAYPNLGYFTNDGWRFETGVDDARFAAMARRWRDEGAQIIGGCCGVGPDHIAAAAEALRGTAAGAARPSEPRAASRAPDRDDAAAHWVDVRGRDLHPLPFPELVRHDGVAAPTPTSLMAWRYLFREVVGPHQRCLDVGTGTGLLAVQLARNGARHVHAIDNDERAVLNALDNAFRNGVAERMTATAVDLYPWVPEERYDVIVASLGQTPVDPFEQVTDHRVRDYWGRSLLDQLLSKLPDALADDGRAYVVQLSIVGRAQTVERLRDAGLVATVVDFLLFPFPVELQESRPQLERVEERSDAYHVTVGDDPAVVAYLLEIRHGNGDDAPDAPWS